MDYTNIYPELSGYLIKPLLQSPPLCTLAELQDGTYTLADLEVLHQVMEIKQHITSITAT